MSTAAQLRASAFNFIKQQYLFNAEAAQNAVALMEGIDETERKRVDYFTRQIVDMMAPTNFLATNPDALERAVATDGESLVINQHALSIK